MPNLRQSYGYGTPAVNNVGSLYRDIEESSTKARRVDRLKRLGYLNAGTPYGPTAGYGDARRASRSAIAIRKLQELRDQQEMENMENEPTSGLEALGDVIDGPADWAADRITPDLPRPRVFGWEPF